MPVDMVVLIVQQFSLVEVVTTPTTFVTMHHMRSMCIIKRTLFQIAVTLEEQLLPLAVIQVSCLFIFLLVLLFYNIKQFQSNIELLSCPSLLFLPSFQVQGLVFIHPLGEVSKL